MTLAQTFRKDESFGFSGGRLLACLILALACWPAPGHAESPRLRVVTRPPVKKSVPTPSRPAAPPAAGAHAAPQAVAIYRHIDEDGTVRLTNRPDGDARYRFFGHFSAGKLMQSAGPQGVARIAERYAALHGVDARLIMAIIATESGGDEKAVSRAGASGLMQLMPETQRHLGVRDAFDAEANVEGGVRYFRSLLDRYKGDATLALAAYNAGPANVDKYGGIPPFAETRAYVRKVLDRWARADHL